MSRKTTDADRRTQQDTIASVDEAPICPGCGLISHPVHEATDLCGECWSRRNLWQHQGMLRYVTEDGDCRHETPLCPALRGTTYYMVKEELVYLDTEACRRCDGYVLFGEFDFHREVTA